MSDVIDIVGGGLTGPLMAIYLARKNFTVRLHERREDMRKAVAQEGRSINLALTARGMKALDEVGLKEKVLDICIPMKGRMVHDTAGNTVLHPYGQKDSEVIYAVSRGQLNNLLLDAAEKAHVVITFSRRCTGYDIDGNLLHFTDADGGAREVDAGIVIGADGAGSAVRKAIMARDKNFAFTNDTLDYSYKELEIPPAAGGGFQLEAAALHIWPHKNFMMIALPNTEGSFTCTLFYKTKGAQSFDQLADEKSVTDFFAAHFPDAVPLMPRLLDDFFSNPTGALYTIKCAPWHHAGKAAILGDAAHAIVPFFAQGMNSGFEDCSFLNSLVVAGENNWEKVFTAFTAGRKDNADAIADMAVENFIEMRDLVTDPHFILKKKVGFALEKRWPDKFIPRYSMVVFRADIPYAEAKARGMAQDKILETLCAGISSPEELNWELAEKLLHDMPARKSA